MKLQSYKRWSFSVVNIRTGGEKDQGAKLYAVAKELARFDLLFCCLQKYDGETQTVNLYNSILEKHLSFTGVAIILVSDLYLKLTNLQTKIALKKS